MNDNDTSCGGEPFSPLIEPPHGRWPTGGMSVELVLPVLIFKTPMEKKIKLTLCLDIVIKPKDDRNNNSFSPVGAFRIRLEIFHY